MLLFCDEKGEEESGKLGNFPKEGVATPSTVPLGSSLQLIHLECENVFVGFLAVSICHLLNRHH